MLYLRCKVTQTDSKFSILGVYNTKSPALASSPSTDVDGFIKYSAQETFGSLRNALECPQVEAVQRGKHLEYRNSRNKEFISNMSSDFLRFPFN
jgi:hypothetical protein